MVQPSAHQELAACLGDLLCYPDSTIGERTLRACTGLSSTSPEAAAELQSFEVLCTTVSAPALEEAYTRAFDMSPQCVPYLSVHLFGEDSNKRSQLMAGLRKTYGPRGKNEEFELPDHLGVVLRFAARFSEADWNDLLTWCIPGPVAEMVRSLDLVQNPYRHVLRAVQLVLKDAALQGDNHG